MESTPSRELLLRWSVALGCFALLLFFFCPPWAAFSLWSRIPELSGMLEVRRGVTVLAQAAHPGAPIADPLHRAIQWRLLFPVIGNILGLSPFALFALADVGCVLVLGYLVTLLRREHESWTNAVLGALAVGAASWFFVSTGWLGYYDSWFALGLLIVGFSRSPWWMWLACLWAPWVDERFVLAAPAALLCRWIYGNARPTTDSISARPGATDQLRLLAREFGIPALLLAVFAVIRLTVLSSHSAAEATVTGYLHGKNYLDAPADRVLLGIWEGLRGGWVLVIVAVILLRTLAARAAALAGVTVALVVVGLATAQDYSRSMTMVVPAAVLGLLLLARNSSKWRTPLLSTTAAAALVLPAHHVMQNWVNPIFYLYHELAAFDSPPPAAMPEIRELRALRAIAQGDFTAAETNLTIAIKLSSNPVDPARERGRLYASVKRWEDAKKDFSLVVQNAPGDPEGWYLRSQVELAMRNLAAATDDFERATSVAPEGWMDRPDVKRYAAMLSQMTGQR